MSDEYSKSKEHEAIERAAIAGSMAVEGSLTDRVGWRIPYEYDDRKSLEDFIRWLLHRRLGT